MFKDSLTKGIMKSLYQMKLKMESTPMSTKKKSENSLKELLSVLPILRKNKLHGEVQTEVRKLRNDRTKRSYTLELSRKVVRPPSDDDVKFGDSDFKVRNSMGEMVHVPVVIERKAVTKDIMVSSVLPSPRKKNEDGTIKTKVQVLNELKEKIMTDIKDFRKAQKPNIEAVVLQGVTVNKLSETYLDPQTFFKIYNKKLRTGMRNSKKPAFDSNYVGVEIEFACVQTKDLVCDKLFDAGLAKYVHVHGDSSIKTDSTHKEQIEISILCLQTEVRNIITRVCNVLNNDLNILINSSCGLHVHLDMRKRDHKKSFANLVTMQNILFAMVPSSRVTGSFSTPVKDKTFDKAVDRSSHYDGISSSAYSKHKTIEVRMHSGSSNPNKIINWIELLTSIADCDKLKKSYTNIKEAQPTLNISNDLCGYVESRIAKFADQHSKNTNKDHLKVMGDVSLVSSMPDTLPIEMSEVA